MSRAFAAWLLAAATTALGCGGPAGGRHAASPKPRTQLRGEGRPPLAVVSRSGDARGALAVAVTTEGLGVDRGAAVAVALAAVVESRLAAQPALANDAPSIVAGWEGYRLRALISNAAGAFALVEAVRRALLTPVDEVALGYVQRKIQALARRPLPDPQLSDLAQCTGEAFGLGGDRPPSLQELEAWRQAAHGTLRVAFAVAGDPTLADVVESALAKGPAWPQATRPSPQRHVGPEAPVTVYDASSEITPGAARIVVVARTASPEDVIEPARRLGSTAGPLGSRLLALESPARVQSVVATAHGDGGCLAVTVDLSARDLEADAADRIATAAALTRQEIAVELADAALSPDLVDELAQRAPDPRDAAERAAWWSLSDRRAEGDAHTSLHLDVGIAPSRDTGAQVTLPALELRAAIDRATTAWHAPVVDSRWRVERGQGENWILLASPCGTLAEADDAGSGAVAATAAALQAGAPSSDEARVEPYISEGGLGVVVHGPARFGESPQAHARRLSDLAARAFAADALDRPGIARARASLLARSSDAGARSLASLAAALAPGHVSWVLPFGNNRGLSAIADDDVTMRIAALRAGPLRVAVLANDDQAQAEAAVQAVDRWVARRPGEVRACPTPTVVRPRPGTYAVDIPSGARSEVLIAAPLAAGDDSRTKATWLAAALGGPDGLLAHAVGPAASEGHRSLATTWDAAVLGAAANAALVVHLTADDASLDASVAQARALLERLRQGGLSEEDRSRAGRIVAQRELTSSLDPRVRLLALWKNAGPTVPPSLDALHAFASSVLASDSLILVAARPARSDTEGPAKRDPHGRSH